MQTALIFILALSAAADVTSAFSQIPLPSSTTPATTTATHINVVNSISVKPSQLESMFVASSTSTTSLTAKGDFVEEEESRGIFDDIQINPPYAIAYFGFLAVGYAMATMEAPGASQVVLEKFLADPVNPGVNELFATVFNLLGLAALPFACLTMPGAKGQKPPLVPFLIGGIFGGYGSIGKFCLPHYRLIG